jgi:hypothetical protein
VPATAKARKNSVLKMKVLSRSLSRISRAAMSWTAVNVVTG